MPLKNKPNHEISARAALYEEYTIARPRSKALHEQARKSMPNGVVHDGRFFEPFPFYVKHADGAYKWDIDGHAYLDTWSGHGALILGHNHPDVVTAVIAQARKGFHYSACHELEVRWAELIRECVPGAERVRFTVTGTETTALALRIARAFTDRTAIIKFQGHFHGIQDTAVAGVKEPFHIPMSTGVPAGTLQNVRLARHNDLDHVQQLLEAEPIAAVILEPAGAHSTVVPGDQGFLQNLRTLTKDHGTLLIFDEVVSGFRLAPGGAQEIFNVTADLVCFAKAVAGGLPGAALVGRADILDSIAFSGNAPRDRSKRVADQGTYSALPIVAAAGIACLEILKTGKVQHHLNALGTRLRDGLNNVLQRQNIAGCAYGNASMFRILLGETCEALGLTDGSFDHARLDRGMGAQGHDLHLALLINGVDYNRGLSTGWLNAAMKDEDVDKMVGAFDRALTRLQQDGLI